MTEAQTVELQIKGLVASLPPESETKVKECVTEILDVMKKHSTVQGCEVGAIAVAVIGSALAAKD